MRSVPSRWFGRRSLLLSDGCHRRRAVAANCYYRKVSDYSSPQNVGGRALDVSLVGLLRIEAHKMGRCAHEKVPADDDGHATVVSDFRDGWLPPGLIIAKWKSNGRIQLVELSDGSVIWM